jgi:hypothetical protein
LWKWTINKRNEWFGLIGALNINKIYGRRVMKLTLSVIKADIGGYVGHSESHPDLIADACNGMAKAKRDGLLIDYHVTKCGDDLQLIMTHKEGEESQKIHIQVPASTGMWGTDCAPSASINAPCSWATLAIEVVFPVPSDPMSSITPGTGTNCASSTPRFCVSAGELVRISRQLCLGRTLRTGFIF